MQITILGRNWNLGFIRRNGRRKWRGRCDKPDSKHKEIVVEKGHSDELVMDTIIHECLHAACWNIDEEYVTRYATDVARVLTACGYVRDLAVKLPLRVASTNET